MNTHADKTQENKNQAVSAAGSQMQNGSDSTFQFEDNRPEAVAQRKLQEMANNSPRAMQLQAVQNMAINSPQAQQAKQLQSIADNHATEQQQLIQKKENNTGLPDNLKTGMENLSGMSLDDVKVHRNSDKPAQLQAHAYAQGTDIHLGPGQEKHLPHEAWHVVQQKQGRVKPTMQMKGGVSANDDAELEKEADVMGAKSLQTRSKIADQEKSSLELKNGQGNLVQLLRWSEVWTGSKKEIGLTEKQKPAGVEEQADTVDRNVWAGQTKKGRSGFMWHKESTLEIQYDIKSMKQYRIIDPDTVFYTAVRDSALEPIKKFGIDPNYGNSEKPDGSTAYNVRGFNYFGKDKKTPRLYGSNYLEPEAWRIISFKLPEGTLIERDPEIPNGLRTSYHIKPSDINS